MAIFSEVRSFCVKSHEFLRQAIDIIEKMSNNEEIFGVKQQFCNLRVFRSYQLP